MKKTYEKKGIVLIIALFLSLTFIALKNSHFKLSRFISPETCGGCHDEIYSQWKNSMHHLSHTDTLYREAALYFLKGLTDKDEIAEAESCVKCHTPVGNICGFPLKTSDDPGKIPDIAKHGIQCDYCHSATGAAQLFNNGLIIEPGHGEDTPGIKRGPFKDSKSDYHESAFSDFHTNAKICGTCHNVRHVVFGTKLETTYEEWEKSLYNAKDPAKRIVCQGCHMHQKPGIPSTGSTARPKNPGKASSDGKNREHIFTHYFVGGNSLIPGLNGDSEKSKMAEDRLKHAAELDCSFDAKTGTLSVAVKNTGAGHSLPTGLTDTRQMWLEVTVTDSGGKKIFSSGEADEHGYLSKNTVMYNTVFGDGKGNPVNNVSKARQILRDRRIPAAQSLTETFKIQAGAHAKIRAEAKLKYRIASQELVDKILGKGKVILPVVEMASVRKTFPHATLNK